MINERQKKILKLVIDKHTRENDSISSLSLVKTPELNEWSSATIRNDMVVLENKGYLRKEYFSSGKIPTKQGYKFYIESLMNEYEGNEEIKKKLQKIFQKRHDSIEQILDECASLISNFLNLPIVLTKNNKSEQEYLRKIDLVSISNTSYILLLITSTGDIIKDFITIEDIDKEKKNDLIVSIRLLNERLYNCPLKEISHKLSEAIETLRKSITQFEFIYEYIISRVIMDKLLNKSKEQGRSYNTKSLITRNEVDVSDFLDLMEKYSTFVPLNYNYLKTGKTMINFDVVEGLAVVTTDIEKDLTTHQLSVIGPIRMNYPLIKYLFDFINETLNKGKN